MSFDSAINYLENYFNSRIRSENNEAPQKWSTHPFKTYNDFLKIYDTKNEMVSWLNAYKQENLTEQTGLQGKMNWMLSSLRDISTLYLSSSGERSASDFSRFNISRCLWQKIKIKILSQILNSQAAK